MKQINFLMLLFLTIFQSITAQIITIAPLSPLVYCAGSPVTISFTATGFSSGTSYTAELSNELGNFNSGTFILGNPSTGSSITGNVSPGQTPAIAYRIRIKASTGYNSGTNGADISITSNPLPDITPIATPASICQGSSSQIISGVSNTNFRITPIAYNRMSVPSSALYGPTGDDVNTGNLNLPFAFNFYGPTYSQFKISTNGNIQFGTSNYNEYEAVSFLNPSASIVRNFIGLCWGDQVINPSNGEEIRYFTSGVAPHRIMVIDWNHCRWFGTDTGYFSGQIQLYEGSNIIEFHLKAAIGFACCAGQNNYKTMGVLNADATTGNAPPGRDRGLWEIDSTQPEAWRFIPPGNYSYLWSNAFSLDTATKDTVIATPASTTSYHVEATNIYTGCIAKGDVTVTVSAPLTPAVTISSNVTGNAVTFTANAVNGGISPTYDWYVDGLYNNTAPSPFTIFNLHTGSHVYCIMTSNAACLTIPTATSNIISVALPVSLLNFQVSLLKASVDLSWQTATESNTSHFNIQRSFNDIDFSNIGKVGAAGNSSTKLSYKFTDNESARGLHYYRLQMVDKDGKFTYSKVIAINITSKGDLVIYPNPVKEELFIQLNEDKPQTLILHITDVQGKIVHQETKNVQPGLNALSINISRLATGNYILAVKGIATQQRVFIKQ